MSLEERLRALLAPLGATDKKMFGGTCFMINGNMLIGTLKGGLIVRIGKEAHAAAIKKTGAKTFDMTGRPMEGYVSVQGDAIANDAGLKEWVDMALVFVRTLPAKAAKKPAKKKKG